MRKRRSDIPDPAAGGIGSGFSPKLLRIRVAPPLFPFPRRVSWAVSHLFYFPALCLACLLSLCYRRPLALVMKPRIDGPPYICSRDAPRRGGVAHQDQGQHARCCVEISGYSFVGWGVIAVDDPRVIEHEFAHVENWLGRFTPGKLAFNIVPLMLVGIFVAPLIGLGSVSFALSLGVVLAFSLMAFVRIFH